MSQGESAAEEHQSDVDDQLDGVDGGGLFGSGSEGEESAIESINNKRRKLDDQDLDSGDDEGRVDRAKDGDDEHGAEVTPERDAIVSDIAIGTHPGPRPSDGELYLLQFPNNVGINPKAFTLKGYEPPVTDHHSSDPPSSTFSAFSTSNNTIRWRQSPRDPSVIQSNAKINRWSDGSLTLQLASNSREQFELTAKPLAQPQINPRTPTATSINQIRPSMQAPSGRLDSHTYLAAPSESAGVIRHVHHVTASLGVQSTEQDDDALLRLQRSLAAATKGNKGTADGGLEVISISEDPENAKKRAELAEKEKSRMQRRLQIQADKENSRANNVLKRSGLRTGGMSSGLTVGGLEDDDGMIGTRGRMPKPKARNARRRNSEYSDDEEFRGRGRNREDEYDEDDGFLVGSDEEPEVGEESEEEAEMDAEGDEDVEEPPKRAEATDEGITGGRNKRRRVIEDEDEE